MRAQTESLWNQGIKEERSAEGSTDLLAGSHEACG